MTLCWLVIVFIVCLFWRLFIALVDYQSSAGFDKKKLFRGAVILSFYNCVYVSLSKEALHSDHTLKLVIYHLKG